MIGASVIAGLAGIGTAYWFYIARPEIPVNLAKQFAGVYAVLWNKYYVDELYSAVFVEPGRRLAMFLWQTVDVGLIDGLANGLGSVTAAFSRVMRGFETGYVRAYALMMLAGTLVLLGWLILK